MERTFKNFFGLLGEKGISTVTAFEETRGGQPKSYIPNFFYKPPFGYPRYKDLMYYRQLAASIYVDMCETAIIDEVCSVQYEIVAEDSAGNEIVGKEKDIEVVDKFFQNPNTNPESWETIIRMMLPDLLEINSGILVKTFNAFGEMVEIVARNGIAFTKNPDIYGMYTHRADLLLVKDIDNNMLPVENQNQVTAPILGGTLSESQAKENAAYFQYGFNTASQPVPFGKREIVWFEKKVRTDDLYGRSAMEVLAKTVQTLIYAVEHNLEYFSDNSIPPGILGLEGMNTADMKAFATQWVESQRKKDELGNWKKVFHKLAMVNKVPHFERLGFTNQELELIESQKWWSKMVWAAFGMTATELGFTEEAKGSANQIVQSAIAKKRIIYPLLRLIEYYVNTQIIPEFGFEGIRYKYKIFDVDDETKKWGLYKLQVESNLKTVNEIRNAEGLDALDGGDETMAMRTERNQDLDREMNSDLRQREADKINNDNQRDRDKKLNRSNDKDTKALGTQTPLTLQPGEELDDDDLEKAILLFLKKNEERVLAVLDSQHKKEPLIAIKGVDDIPDMIKKVFEIFTARTISDQVIQDQYNGGWDFAEKQLDRNIQFNKAAVQFLQDYTFDNIKSMTQEIANDLRAELERGIISGESITKLKERVTKVFDVGENRAFMIARTETNRAENQGKLQAFKTSGEDLNKKYHAVLDDRTSAICRRLNGQVVGIKENFKDKQTGWEGPVPPAHVNCRSATLYIKEGEE